MTGETEKRDFQIIVNCCEIALYISWILYVAQFPL